MRKCHINITWVLIAALVIAVAVGVIWTIVSSQFQPEKEKIEKQFLQDKETLSAVADYLICLEHPFVSIDKTSIENGEMFTGANTGYQKIENKAVYALLKELLKKYIVIGKNNNTVFFQKWRFLEKDRGIAVVINKDEYPSIEFLVESEPLPEAGWYYYEADYEEYRNR